MLAKLNAFALVRIDAVPSRWRPALVLYRTFDDSLDCRKISRWSNENNVTIIANFFLTCLGSGHTFALSDKNSRNPTRKVESRPGISADWYQLCWSGSACADTAGAECEDQEKGR